MSFRLLPNSVTLDDLERRNSPITNSKSHMVPKSVTLNDLERRNGRYIALFH